MEKNITIFKNLAATKEPHYLSLDDVHARIKDGGIAKARILTLRGTKGKEDQKKLKDSLPCILFSGRFKQRLNSGLETHSGLVCIDFDKLGKKLPALKNELIKDPYTAMVFVSPRGNGLKLVMKIPPSIETHADSCRSITKYLEETHSVEVDEFRDVARISYQSYDPGVFYNTEVKLYEGMEKELEKEIDSKFLKDGKFVIPDLVTDYDQIYLFLKKWLEEKKLVQYADGNKHVFLTALSSACNRYGIPSEVTVHHLLHDYINAASKVNPKDFEDIVNRVYKTYAHQFNTEHFEEQKKSDKKAVELKDEIFDNTLPPKDIIRVQDIKDTMLKSFHYGSAIGETTYFPTIDLHFKWKKGEVTLMGGIGNAGKSAMVMQLALIKAIKEDTKVGIFSPENYPPTDFYDDLIQTFIGKPTTKGVPGQMSEDEYRKGMNWINDHFYYVYPEAEDPTPNYINDKFYELIKNYGVTMCITDPFNQLDNDWKSEGRDDHYISAYLKKEKKFAMEMDIYKIIVAHPNSSLAMNKNGDYECPKVYNLAGGAMWSHKCDNILMYHRPFFNSDPQNPLCHFVSRKIKKQKLVGIPGTVELTYNRIMGRFIDSNGFTPFDPNYRPPVEKALSETLERARTPYVDKDEDLFAESFDML